MKFKLFFILVLSTIFSCTSNTNSDNHSEVKKKIEIPDFFAADSLKPKVLLLGTFHFKDAGADGYKPKYDIDIMYEKRQKELEDLLMVLEKFKPSQIIVEVKTHQQERLDSLYSEYLYNRFELPANEIYQIGFKLGRRMGIEQLIAGDIMGKEYDYISSDFEAYRKRKKAILEEEHLEERLENDYGDRYNKLYSYLDSLKTQMTLSEFLLLENEDTILSLKHGHYLLGGIGINNGQEYPSADNLSGWWYNRNLRIVSNIRKSIRNSEERVLVLFGAGHMPIIKHALEASPEIEVIDLKTLFSSIGTNKAPII